MRSRLFCIAVLWMAIAAIARADHVDDVIVAQMKERGIAGVALAVIDGGAIVREQAYGYADKERQTAVTASTLFQAASISKPVAALGALHLVDEGKLSLDEDVNLKLRSWRVPENVYTKAHPVTLRTILSHSGGFTVHGFSGYAQTAAIPSLVQILDGKAPANSAAIRVQKIPGSEWSYSGGGYLVMQQLVEDVSGEPFGDYMEAAVLKPLAMQSSTYLQTLPAGLAGLAATGYTGRFHRAIPGGYRIHPELAAAGLWTTAGDLARCLIAVQRSVAGSSNVLISRALTREMLTRQKSDSGLGFFLGGKPLRFGHNGDVRGFNSVMVAFAELGKGTVILMNTNTDIEVVKNIFVRALAEQYHWPG